MKFHSACILFILMLGLNSTLGFLFSFGLFSDPKIIGETEFGKIEGTSSTGRDGRTIYEFLGIPYGIPPTGDLRFRSSVPWNTSWDGVRDATEYGEQCQQFHLVGKFMSGSEDCLFLNVYTHRYKKEAGSDEDNNDQKLSPLSPVIVYFHGGLFMHGGSNRYTATYLLDSDVVFVTVNYRLGILGFLNLESEDIMGNQGLKDQVLALKWVQRNIANFGGDPNIVTLMGQSAGGVCVHYHILSPLSRGQSVRVGMFSFLGQTKTNLSRAQALSLATKLGCTNETMKDIAECLRGLDAHTIVESQRSASTLLRDRYSLYAPTIEVPHENAFITDLPQNIIQSGNFSKVPWIVGTNSDEGLIYSAPIIKNEVMREEMNKNWTTWAPILFRFSDEPNKMEIAEKIKEYYLGNSSAEISMDVLHNITQFFTDRSFFEGLHNSLILHRGQHPVYPYVYAYEGKFSFAKVLFGMSFSLPSMADIVVTRSWNWFLTSVFQVPEPSYGIAHGDELALLYKFPIQAEINENSRAYSDFNMSSILVKTWGSFAKDGVPPSVNNISWPMLSAIDMDNETVSSESTQPFDSNNPIQFLKLNRTMEVVDEPFHERAEFWRKLNLLPYKIPSSEIFAECNHNGSLSCNNDEAEGLRHR